MFRRVITLLFCLIIIFVAIFGFAVGVVSVPTLFSYATVNDDSIYVPLRDPSDAVIAFQAYCKSRDLTIEGSLADAVTTFTTGVFNSACNEIGINVSQLQAEIKAEYDESGKPVKFFFNDTGVMAMNRIFAQFLQDNELEVGDVVNDIAYDGKSYNGSLLWITNKGDNSSLNTGYSSSMILQRGSAYLYDQEQILSWVDLTLVSSETLYKDIPLPNGTYSCKYYKASSNGRVESVNSGSYSGKCGFYWRRTYNITYACNVLVYDIYQNKYYFGVLSQYEGDSNIYFYNLKDISLDTAIPNIVNVQINITTNNNTINNNNYEGDTYITNEGDIINNPSYPDQPDSDDYTIPYNPYPDNPNYDPSDPTNIHTPPQVPTDPDNPNNINFPDIDLDLPDINWSIGDLSGKFPFSIPFDLVALVRVLDAPPEAPRFDGTLNLGITTYDYDINLEPFSPVASACRIAETLLFVFVLILITRNLIKG